MTTIEQLMARDRAFCLASQTDKQDAWKRFLAPDAIVGTAGLEPYLVGWESIEPGIEQLYRLESLTFTWDPVHAFVSEDHTLGITSGTYERTFQHQGQSMTQVGKYVSVWRNIDQEWYVVFDMGN